MAVASGAARQERRPVALLTLFTALSLVEGVYYPSLFLSGACDSQNDLNGLIFEHKGMTAIGSPYYKAVDRSEYLYFDPDCSGSQDGTPRWILDSTAPSETAQSDLDGDGACSYHARTDTAVNNAPPISATWKMQCGETLAFEARFVTLAEITTTSTTTTSSTKTETTTSTTATTTSTVSSTTRTGTSTTTTSVTQTTTSTISTTTVTSTSTISSTTRTDTTTTRTMTATSTTSTTSTHIDFVTLMGACTYKEFLNNLTFKTYGHLASGMPFYKATDAEQYLYYDSDCNGDGQSEPRWIIDHDAPSLTAEFDLDQDGECNYHARLVSDMDGELSSDNETLPPSVGLWKMYCGGVSWVEVILRISESPEDEVVDFEDGEVVEALRLEGAPCGQTQYMGGATFVRVGETASGAPYFKAESADVFLYFDPSCDGASDSDLNDTDFEPTAARWIIDDDKPDELADEDLDGDGECQYHARVKSESATSPPSEAMWRVNCGAEGSWQDTWITLRSVPAPSTTTTTAEAPTTPGTSTDADADAGAGERTTTAKAAAAGTTLGEGDRVGAEVPVDGSWRHWSSGIATILVFAMAVLNMF